MEEIHRWGKGHGKDTEFPCPLQPSTWFSLKLPMFTNSKAHQTPLFGGILVSSLHLHDWLSHWQLMTELNLQTLSPPSRKSYPTLCDPTDCSMPGFPVRHQLPELAQIHIHVYELNKQGDNIQPWHTPFPILNQSIVPCPFLTVTSWPAYGFLRRQMRWSDMPITLRIFHSLSWSTQSKASA